EKEKLEKENKEKNEVIYDDTLIDTLSDIMQQNASKIGNTFENFEDFENPETMKNFNPAPISVKRIKVKQHIYAPVPKKKKSIDTSGF
ncbi:MAG: hypothetical protein KAQ92_00145, partial [Candidatus Aenigmarchaeota archaeon]|nr:hypothetical protein [Candidatus Aenigmarchaeota archaeon]